MKASDIDLVSIQDAVDANADSYALIIENTELRKQQLKKLRYPRVLDQGGVPIYILPTGSVAANGAITLGTALAVIESGGLWGYLPAGAAYAASAAGFYWMVMSSTTLGTIYNNTYVPGTTDWRIPTTLVAIVDAGPGAYTGVAAAEITAVSVPMAGGAMGNNGSIKIEFIGSHNSSVGNKSYRAKLGTSTFFAIGATTSFSMQLFKTVRNKGVQNAQITPPLAGFDGTGSSASEVLALAVDTTAPVSAAFSLQLATATDYVCLRAWGFEVRYQS